MSKNRLSVQSLIGYMCLTGWLVALGTAGLGQSPAQAAVQSTESECSLLPEAILRQSLKYQGPLSQSSQIKTRCQYQWPKADLEQRQTQNQSQLRQSMRMGAEAYAPVSLYNQVEVELLNEFDSLTQAQTEFTARLKDPVGTSFGSPEPLDGVKWEVSQNTKDKAIAWNKEQGYLLVQSANRLILLRVQLDEDPAKNKSQAYMLADKLK